MSRVAAVSVLAALVVGGAVGGALGFRCAPQEASCDPLFDERFAVVDVRDAAPEDPPFTPMLFRSGAVSVESNGDMFRWSNGVSSFSRRVGGITCVYGDASRAYVGDSYGNVFVFEGGRRVRVFTRFPVEPVRRVLAHKGRVWAQRGRTVTVDDEVLTTSERGDVELRAGPALRVEDLLFVFE